MEDKPDIRRCDRYRSHRLLQGHINMSTTSSISSVTFLEPFTVIMGKATQKKEEDEEIMIEKHVISTQGNAPLLNTLGKYGYHLVFIRQVGTKARMKADVPFLTSFLST